MFVTTINTIHNNSHTGEPLEHPLIDAPSMMTAPTRVDALAIAHRILDKLAANGYGEIVQDVNGHDPIETIVFQFTDNRYYVWSIAEVKE